MQYQEVHAACTRLEGSALRRSPGLPGGRERERARLNAPTPPAPPNGQTTTARPANGAGCAKTNSKGIRIKRQHPHSTAMLLSAPLGKGLMQQPTCYRTPRNAAKRWRCGGTKLAPRKRCYGAQPGAKNPGAMALRKQQTASPVVGLGEESMQSLYFSLRRRRPRCDSKQEERKEASAATPDAPHRHPRLHFSL